MFLKELWHFNKKGTLLFLLFILSWIFINFKEGAVATPILEYGMYSEVYHISDTQVIIQPYINNKPLDFTKYTMSEKDQLQIYLEAYLRENKNNEMVFNTMQRIFNNVGMGRHMKKEYYTNHISDNDFTKWYKRLAEKITGEKINLLEAFQQKYTWLSGQLTAIDAPVKVPCFVAY